MILIQKNNAVLPNHHGRVGEEERERGVGVR